MLCRKPFVKAGAAFPCGQCMPCRFNRRRMWTHRIMLEGLCHVQSAFVTLTYSDDNLPVGGNLNPKHLQDWLKRLRAEVDPVKLRFYGVGEYGDVTMRPHYHVIIFGLAGCVRFRTMRRAGSGEPVWSECCDMCRIYGNSWGFGNVDVGTVTKDSASYVCEYTVKKMTSVDDNRLHGKHPEFCRMSLRPGIGADAMWDVASTMFEYGLDKSMIDVPLAVDQARAKMPLGRYLRTKLREYIGKDGGTPEEVLKEMAEEMRPLREAAFASSSSFSSAVVAAGDGQVANIYARNAIYKKDKKL